MLLAILLLVAGLVALYFGAEWLVTGAAKISLKFGITPLAVGLTVVAFGTSAPELFISLKFNTDGQPDMALGNVVGSNLCNIGMVLGISAFICALHVKRTLLIRDMTALILASVVFVGMLRDGKFERWEGLILFGMVLIYTIARLIVAKRDVASGKEELLQCRKAAMAESNVKLALEVLIGLVVLYLGSEAMERGGITLAEKLGVPGAIISLTVIAFSTSVPELATSVVASLKKEGDLITGNIVGSCLFNLLCVIGLTALVEPINISHIQRVDLFVMLAFTILLFPMMLTRQKVDRFEGGILLIGYTVYCGYLWMERI